MSVYYNLILAYSIYFLSQCFKSRLPWALPEGSVEYWNRDYFYKEFLKSSDSINDMGILKILLFRRYSLDSIWLLYIKLIYSLYLYLTWCPGKW